MASKVTGIGFRVIQYMEYAYERIELEVSRIGNYSHTELFTFTWQADDNARAWYGCTLKLAAQNAVFFAEATKLATRIIGKDDSGMQFFTQPTEIIERLESIGIYQAVYDVRTHGYVLLSECLPAEVNDYAEDYTRCGFPYRQARCLASSEDEARKLIRQELAGMSAEKVQAFINAGEPVRIMAAGSQVDRRKWQEVIHSKYIAANLAQDAELTESAA